MEPMNASLRHRPPCRPQHFLLSPLHRPVCSIPSHTHSKPDQTKPEGVWQVGERAGPRALPYRELTPSLRTASPPLQKEACSSAARRGPGLQEGRGEGGGEGRLPSSATRPSRSARLSVRGRQCRPAGRAPCSSTAARTGRRVGAALSHFHSLTNGRPQGLWHHRPHMGPHLKEEHFKNQSKVLF